MAHYEFNACIKAIYAAQTHVHQKWQNAINSLEELLQEFYGEQDQQTGLVHLLLQFLRHVTLDVQHEDCLLDPQFLECLAGMHVMESIASKGAWAAVQSAVDAQLDCENDYELRPFTQVEFLRQLTITIQNRRQRRLERVRTFKEELMAVAWSPERVERWIAAGLEMEDL